MSARVLADILQLAEEDRNRIELKRVAAVLGISVYSVRRWCVGGRRGRRLESITLAGRRWTTWSAVAEFLAPEEQPTTPNRCAASSGGTNAARTILDQVGI